MNTVEYRIYDYAIQKAKIKIPSNHEKEEYECQVDLIDFVSLKYLYNIEIEQNNEEHIAPHILITFKKINGQWK